MESAVLDRFCADQLDVVLQRDDSARMLAAVLQSGNLFLISLDAERIWFRYHGLFGDLLRARLRDHQPNRHRVLATRAADLLEHEGDIDGALASALLAGDRARAAELVGREAVRLGFDGRAGVLARRIGLLDEQTFVDYPDAAIARAWLGVSSGEADLIQRSLMLAHRADRGKPLADGTPSVSVAAALVGSLVGVGGVREVVRHAQVVRDAGDHLVNPWWGAATVMKGAAMSMLGEDAQARVLLEAALPAIGELPGFRAAALAHLALLDLTAGDDIAAAERRTAARAIADHYDLCDVVPMVVVYAADAVIAARLGDVDRTRAAIEVDRTTLEQAGKSCGSHRVARPRPAGVDRGGDRRHRTASAASEFRGDRRPPRTRGGGSVAQAGSRPGIGGGRAAAPPDRRRIAAAAVSGHAPVAKANRRGVDDRTGDGQESGRRGLPQTRGIFPRRRRCRSEKNRPT